VKHDTQQKIAGVLENYLHCKTRLYLQVVWNKSDYGMAPLSYKKKDSVGITGHYRIAKYRQTFFDCARYDLTLPTQYCAQFENEQFSLSFDGLVKNEQSASGNPLHTGSI
jgi:hypothetical protein